MKNYMEARNRRIEAFSLVDQAIRLQLEERGELSEVESCLTRALELDPHNIEALEEAAHFYDAVVPAPQKAQIGRAHV